MAKIKPSRSYKAFVQDGFSGMGSKTPLGIGTDELCNLRIKKDGSMISREGYRMLFQFPNKRVRGFWEGNIEGRSCFFAAVGEKIYLLDLELYTKTTVGTIPPGEDAVCFLFHEGTLYLLSGDAILAYVTSEKCFSEAEPYTPLYGQNWHPVLFGDVNEPLNLLTPRIRIHYANDPAHAKIYLPFYAKQIDVVRMGYRKMRPEEYILSDTKKSIEVAPESLNTFYEIAFTIDLEREIEEHLKSSKIGLVQPGIQYDKMFLVSGTPDARLYPSATVTDAMLTYCRIFHPKTLPLYFREKDALYVGSREDPVNSLLLYRENALAMTNREAWMLKWEKNVAYAERLAEELGSVGNGSITHCGDAVALCGPGEIRMLRSPFSRPEDLTLTHIPYPDAMTLAERQALWRHAQLYWNETAEELWVRDSENTDGTVWVWNTVLEVWYRFDHIPAVRFFSVSHGYIFGTDDGTIYLFDPKLDEDDGEPYSLRWRSTLQDLESPEAKKRALRICVAADLDGGNATLDVLQDQHSQTLHLSGKADGGIEHFDCRIPTRRYRFLQLAFVMPASSGVKLCKIAGYTKL